MRPSRGLLSTQICQGPVLVELCRELESSLGGLLSGPSNAAAYFSTSTLDMEFKSLQYPQPPFPPFPPGTSDSSTMNYLLDSSARHTYCFLSPARRFLCHNPV